MWQSPTQLRQKCQKILDRRQWVVAWHCLFANDTGKRWNWAQTKFTKFGVSKTCIDATGSDSLKYWKIHFSAFSINRAHCCCLKKPAGKNTWRFEYRIQRVYIGSVKQWANLNHTRNLVDDICRNFSLYLYLQPAVGVPSLDMRFRIDCLWFESLTRSEYSAISLSS